MYSLPSASQSREPLPRTMNGGSPPTARKARTGESTPPGMTFSARACNSRERSSLRVMKCLLYQREPGRHSKGASAGSQPISVGTAGTGVTCERKEVGLQSNGCTHSGACGHLTIQVVAVDQASSFDP